MRYGERPVTYKRGNYVATVEHDPLRRSGTMRMYWKDFVDDLEADLYKRKPGFRGSGSGPQRDIIVIQLLMDNGGGKCRFRCFWKDEHLRLDLYYLEVGGAEFMRLFRPPTEIQCL